MHHALPNPEQQIDELVRRFADHRQRPCLTVVDPFIDPQTTSRLHQILCEHDGDGGIDVILHSPGGCACCGYTFARQLRRRFDDVAVFVPLGAKSAATLIALAGTELIFGPFSEIGPLDALQSEPTADRSRSHLERTQALRHIHGFACRSFDEIATVLGRREDFSTEDARRIATDIVARLSEPLFARLDPEALAESERQLDLGSAYAGRILRRYRPDLSPDFVESLIGRLVHGYPSHSFIIDLEECLELGLPARAAAGHEAVLLDRIADAFRQLDRGPAILGFQLPQAPEATLPRRSSRAGKASSEVAVIA